MEYIKTIVCFANSRKMGGRCIAGKEWVNGSPGKWVRPVSLRPTHEISEGERLCANGRDPQLLDILNVPCNSHLPLAHQNENHVIDPDHRWTKQGELPWADISRWLDTPEVLWCVGPSSRAGINNRVPVGRENGISLYLISVENLRLLVGRKCPGDAHRSVWGKFVYHNVTYVMTVTDPIIERNYLTKNDGQYDIYNPILCISLGDLYEGYYYKLIAGVLYPKRSLTVYTIGHSNHTIDVFTDLLRRHEITAICDVRSHPYNRYMLQYSYGSLRDYLKKAGIAYVFLGKELGGRSNDPSCYREGRVQYEIVAKQPIFLEGINRVINGAKLYRIALMCSEKDPIECHRSLLVARSLSEIGLRVEHILADGSLENHHNLESRLLTVCGFPTDGDLITTREEYIKMAYARQNRRVAYRDDTESV